MSISKIVEPLYDRLLKQKKKIKRLEAIIKKLRKELNPRPLKLKVTQDAEVS